MQLAKHAATLVALVLLGAACAPGGSSTDRAAAAGAATAAFVPPAGTIAVGFSVDDSANRVYGPGDLQWKGSFLFDPATRALTLDPSWTCSWAPPWPDCYPILYDDGPWTAGGHEPAGAIAGDHVWGIAVFVAPAVDPLGFEYGLEDASYLARLGEGWIWPGLANGSFVVPAAATEPISLPVLTMAKFGSVDLRLAIDTANLAPAPPDAPPGWTWPTSPVTVKSSVWGWGELALEDEGGGVYELTLSELIGRNALLPHTGLQNPGALEQFVFVLGGLEYRDWGGTSAILSQGVTASTRARGAQEFTPQPIFLLSNLNTAITVPACVPDVECTPEGDRNPCLRYVTLCPASGKALCEPIGPHPDDTPCPEGTCHQGVCGPEE